MAKITRDLGSANQNYTQTPDVDLTVSPQISYPHSNPFVFVTKPYVLQNTNPPVISFQVKASWDNPPNTQVLMPYFGIMYNT
jgi:hypothetical protein